MVLVPRKPSKTIVQRDQFDLFAQVRARFADLGVLGTLSTVLGLSATLCVFGAFITTGEDFWLRPALTRWSYWFLALLVLSFATELSRSMRWLESKAMLACLHAAAVFGTLLLIGVLIWQTQSILETRAAGRAAESARIKALEEAAEHACRAKRLASIKRAGEQRAEALRLLAICEDAYRASKNIFTQDTVEQRCKQQRFDVETSERDYKAASMRSCKPAGK
jgi:hypothetical protein